MHDVPSHARAVARHHHRRVRARFPGDRSGGGRGLPGRIAPPGAVTGHQIGDLVNREGIELDRHALHLREPIKALGDYKIDVRIMPGVDAVLNVSVVPET